MVSLVIELVGENIGMNELVQGNYVGRENYVALEKALGNINLQTVDRRRRV